MNIDFFLFVRNPVGDGLSTLLLREHIANSLEIIFDIGFVRITLVNPRLTERLTIDLSLSYEDVRSGHTATIPHMAIVELKQDGNSLSTAKRLMRDMRIPPLKVSKYCLGTALTVEAIKKNRMKQKLRDIEKRIGYGRLTLSHA